MSRRLDDLWGLSLDLDSDSVEPTAAAKGPDDEVQDILDAWFRERSQRIESVLILDEVRRLLGRLVTAGALGPEPNRQARRILRAIRALDDA